MDSKMCVLIKTSHVFGGEEQYDLHHRATLSSLTSAHHPAIF